MSKLDSLLAQYETSSGAETPESTSSTPAQPSKPANKLDELLGSYGVAGSDSTEAAPKIYTPNPFVSTAKSTAASMANAFAGQPLEDIGEAIGSETLQKTGKGVREFAEKVQRENPSQIGSLSDIVEKPLTAVETALGNVAPQIPVSLAGGYAGAKLGGSLPLPLPAKAVAAGVGGILGAFAPNYLQEAAEMRGKQHDSGVEDKSKAYLTAIPAAGLETASDVLLAGKFLPKAVKETAVGKALSGIGEDALSETGSRAAHIGKQALKGAGTEASTEYAQTALEQLGGNQDLSTEEAKAEREVSAALGAIGGGAIGGGVSAFDKRTVEAPPAEEGTEQQPATSELDLRTDEDKAQQPIDPSTPADTGFGEVPQPAGEPAINVPPGGFSPESQGEKISQLDAESEEAAKNAKFDRLNNFVNQYQAKLDLGGIPTMVGKHLREAAIAAGTYDPADKPDIVFEKLKAAVEASKPPELRIEEAGKAAAEESNAAIIARTGGSPSVAERTFMAANDSGITPVVQNAEAAKKAELDAEQSVALSVEEIPLEQIDPETGEIRLNLDSQPDDTLKRIWLETGRTPEEKDQARQILESRRAAAAQQSESQETTDALEDEEASKTNGGGISLAGIGEGNGDTTIPSKGVSPEGQADRNIPGAEQLTTTEQQEIPENGKSEDQTAQTTTQEVTDEIHPFHPVLDSAKAGTAELANDLSANNVPPETIAAITERQERRAVAQRELDPTIGFEASKYFKPAMERVIRHVSETGEPTFFIDGDLANLGGLNAHFGNNTDKANVIYKGITDIFRNELSKAGTSAMFLKHGGGDEFGSVVFGTDSEKLSEALASASAKIKAFVESQGLSDIVHPKYKSGVDEYGASMKGTGLHAGFAKIEPGATLEEVRTLAALDLDNSKKGKGNVGRTQNANAGGARTTSGREESGTGGNETQAGRQDAGASVQMGERTGETATAPVDEVAAEVEATKEQVSDQQEQNGDYKKPEIEIAGIPIELENAGISAFTPAGSTRKGVGANGEEWETTLVDHYGELKGTKGADGDPVDVFVVPGTTDFKTAFIVDQMRVGPDGKQLKEFDEHKVILGAKNRVEAAEIYKRNYAPDWNGMGHISYLGKEGFKKWLANPEAQKSPSGTTQRLVAKGAAAEAKKATAAPKVPRFKVKPIGKLTSRERLIYSTVAKKFGVPTEVISGIAKASVADLESRNEEGIYPLNTVRIAAYGGSPRERYVEYVKRFAPDELTTSEAEDGIKTRHGSNYPQYLEWAKEGIQPPLISVSETENGNFQSSSRRRTLAAKAAGKSINGWFSPINQETRYKDPLKYGDILDAIAETDADLRSENIRNTDDLLTTINKLGGISREAAEGIDPAAYNMPVGNGVVPVFRAEGGRTLDDLYSVLDDYGWQFKDSEELSQAVWQAVKSGEKIYNGEGSVRQAEKQAKEQVSDEEAQAINDFLAEVDASNISQADKNAFRDDVLDGDFDSERDYKLLEKLIKQAEEKESDEPYIPFSRRAPATQTDLFATTKEEMDALRSKQGVADYAAQKDKRRQGNGAEPPPLFSDYPGFMGQTDIEDREQSLPELFEAMGRIDKAPAVINHPDAERIRYVQDNFLDLLSELETNDKVEIKC